ncbi:MAG: single-stranded DNA-binding protein [Bacteroidaceae bacterium]|nr:single-stranded DNA-binding protein [Bacteroidaceae bacterium]
MSVNKQIIIGNLGKDPDVRTYQDGSKACRFTVAVTEKGYTMQNRTTIPDHTEWFNILCRAKKAEVAEQYLHKGDKVYIEGVTYTGEYQDQNGQARRYTEVRCEVLELLTPKSQSQAQPQQGFVPAQPAPQPAPSYVQQPPYVPAPQPAQPVGVFGQTSQAVPVEKPW